jgi:hypothetical protein
MRDYLTRRAEDKELISPVIARLRELQYLDDARYAIDYARQHARTRRQGRFRIARELRGRGVPDRYIESALDAVFAETDEAALVRAREAPPRAPSRPARPAQNRVALPQLCSAPDSPLTSSAPNFAISRTPIPPRSMTWPAKPKPAAKIPDSVGPAREGFHWLVQNPQ